MFFFRAMMGGHPLSSALVVWKSIFVPVSVNEKMNTLLAPGLFALVQQIIRPPIISNLLFSAVTPKVKVALCLEISYAFTDLVF